MEAENAPEGWAIPEGVTVAPEVDLSAADPAASGKRRQCVALTRKGARCPTTCPADSILCAAHAGKLDASAGGRARAQTLRLVREEAEERMVIARMGARAVVAARAVERAADLREAFDVVLDDTIAGDKQQARALLGYLSWAFPEAQEAERPGGEASDLTSLSTAQLRALAHPPQEPQSQS